jgi:hypothetical protein
LKQKKRPVLDITGFFFRIRTQVTALVLRTSANSFVSIIMYLTCTIGMAYIFTLLMFRKPNKTTINKNKTTNCYRSTSFRFSFIFRYFKVFQVSQIFTCGLSDLLWLAVGSLVILVLREYILKVHILVSSEHKLSQIWNTCIVSCILFFFKQIVDIKSQIY